MKSFMRFAQVIVVVSKDIHAQVTEQQTMFTVDPR